MPRIHRLIDEATSIPSIELIGFTGGECFLLGRDLDALVEHAARVGFATRVMTNGYWAVNQRAANERMAGLRACGLDEMVLSTGTFHQRFVRLGNVVAAARAAAAAGVAARIAIEDCDQSTFDDGLLQDELADLVAAGKLSLARHAWIEDGGGRGTTPLSHERLIGEYPGGADGPCAQVLNVISVTPDQDVRACCGFPLEQLPRLRLGSIADRALGDVLDETPDELLKMWLHVGGPAEIAQFVARHLPGYALPASPSICQSCAVLQRDERAMNVIATHADEILSFLAPRYFTQRPSGPSVQRHTKKENAHA